MSVGKFERTIDFSAIAQAIRQAGRSSTNEEELRIAVEGILTNALRDLEITTHRAQERTIVSGRADAIYGDIVIEYKTPGTFRTPEGVNEAIYGRVPAGHGLHSYLLQLAKLETFRGEPLEEALARKLGVGLDGEKIFFYRYRADAKVIPIPAGQTTLTVPSETELHGVFETIQVSDIERGINRFMLYLRSLARLPLTATVLVEEFGIKSPTGSTLMQKLYRRLEEHLGSSSPRVEVLYREWERIFGIVYDAEAGGQRFTHEDLTFPGEEGIETKLFLFTAHTYINIVVQFLVLDVLSSLKDPFVIREDFLTLDAQSLRDAISKLEEGELFRLRGVDKFFEGSYFRWYLDCWDEDLSTSFRAFLERLERVDPATTVIKPETAKDILKELYQNIIPERLRHNLGEYFTPDWLAERVCDLAGYDGDPAVRVLDPACGSGTFLVEVIRRLRRKLETEHPDKSQSELLSNVLEHVVGYDINPVSALISKANYLLALGDLVLAAEGISIPVFPCDSILAPKLESGISNPRYYEVNTVVGPFKIPSLGATGKGAQARIQTSMDRLSGAILENLGYDVFLAELRARGVTYDEGDEPLLHDLYLRIEGLHQQGLDGIWPRILSSSFAPVFDTKFDLVIGNPPWVNWDALSRPYKDATEPLWREVGLYETYHGDKDDICFLMTRIAMKRYLKDQGKLVFILPQSIWQSKEGANEFRKLEIPRPSGSSIPINVVGVEDFSSFQPFEATNRTSVAVLSRGVRTEWPVPYRLWKKRGDLKPLMVDTWATASELLESYDWVAKPVDAHDKSSPWLVLPRELINSFDPIIGNSDYQAREGVNTRGRNGVYYVDIVEGPRDRRLEVENDPNAGRINLHRIRRKVDLALVYPLLRGSDLKDYKWSISKFIIVPHSPGTGMKPIPVTKMVEQYNGTFRFLKEFKTTLERRSAYRHAQPASDPFYQLYEIGPYTFADYKVVWPYVRATFSAAILEPYSDPRLGKSARPVIPDTKLMMVACQDRDEACFVAGILNSLLCKIFVARLMVQTQISTYLLKYFKIPKFDAKNPKHSAVAKAFEALIEEDPDEPAEISRAVLDEAVMQVFGLSKKEEEAIRHALAIISQLTKEQEGESDAEKNEE